MITEICDGLYLISSETVFERNGSYNSYLIRGDRDVLIDAGQAEKCRETITEALEQLGVKKDSLDFFSTHMHIDHAGSVAELGCESSTLYVHENASVYKDISSSFDGYTLCGLPHDISAKIGLGTLGLALPGNMNIKYVSDGTRLSFGKYEFVCVHTPGHADEHCCLYETKRKFLFSGDVILPASLPCTTDHSADDDCVSAYMRTLDCLEALDVKQVLPGHGIIDDFYGTIRNTREMLKTDLVRQLDRLDDEPRSVVDILSVHGWNLHEMRLGAVYSIHFRLLALLNHLVKNKLVRREVGADGIYRFVRL